MNVGILGLGNWGRKVLKTLGAIPGVRVTRVASNNSASAGLVPSGCVVRENWVDVVESPDVDAVIVSTPAGLHAEMTLAALQAGKSVFVEKPMATSVKAAEEIVASAKKSVLHVNHIDLFNPAWLALKNNLWRIGKIRLIDAQFGSTTEQSALWNWGPHPVALCVDLLGEPVEVKAEHRGERLLIDLRYQNFASAQIDVSSRLDTKSRKMILTGENGSLVYDDTVSDKVILYGDGWEERIEFASTPPLECVLKRFVESVRRRDPSSDGELGASVVRILAKAECDISVTT